MSYDLAGGNAVGAQFAVGSVLATTVAGLSMAAPQGTTGVAYVGYQPPRDSGSTLFWVGRAPLEAAPGGWRAVDVAGRSFSWTRYDLATGQRAPVSSPPTAQPSGPSSPDPTPDSTTDQDQGADRPATVAEFAGRMGGDGPGFFAVGFGCDGARFSIDALRVGRPGDVTTYDLEGWTSSAVIAGSTHRVLYGDGLTLSGVLRDNAGGSLDHGLLVLEARPFGRETFQPVLGATRTVDAGDPVLTVTPQTRTFYRWRFAGSWSVNGSVSPAWSVDVAIRVLAKTVTAPAPAPAPSADAESDADPGETAPLVVITGSAEPARPGAKATLWRVSGPKRTALATATIADDGTFRFEVPTQPRAPWQYVVTVPGAGGLLAGQSALEVAEASAGSGPAARGPSGARQPTSNR